jgi:thiamine biosynthesis lipoprotein
VSHAVHLAGWTLADGDIETALSSFAAMGTRVEVCLPGLPAARGHDVADMIRREIERVESRLSRFRPDSVISRLNREAWRRPQRLPAEEWRLLRCCVAWWQLSDGAFDVGLAAVTEIWRAVRQGLRSAPDRRELRRLLPRVGLKNVRLDSRRRTVAFAFPEVRLDLGGVGKGYALERIRRLLVSEGINTARVDLGGSSILLHGEAAPGRPWRIQLERPLRPGAARAETAFRDTSVTTSGGTYQHVLVDEKRFGHVLDPSTGLGIPADASVTVVTTSPVLGEILATALLVNPRHRLRRRFTRSNAVSIIVQDRGRAPGGISDMFICPPIDGKESSAPTNPEIRAKMLRHRPSVFNPG